MSLVLIWPSTVIRLKEVSTARRSAASGSASVASVWTKQSIVAMFGSIIPAPFAWAERVTPSRVRVQCLDQRSVVEIASVKAAPPSGESAFAAASIPGSTLPIGIGSPITPVSATATCAVSRPSASAARSDIASASSKPFCPVSALALPELITAARTSARSTTSRQTRIGAAAEALRVRTIAERTPAASQTSRPTSVAPPPFSPTWTPPARKPGASWDGSSSSTPAGASTQLDRKKPSTSGRGSYEPRRLVEPQHQVQVLDALGDAPFQMLSIAEKAITRPRSSTVT